MKRNNKIYTIFFIYIFVNYLRLNLQVTRTRAHETAKIFIIINELIPQNGQIDHTLGIL